MYLKQHVDLITFTLTIQRATLPSVILGDAHAYASMCVPGADSEILKKGGPLCPPPWLADEENFTIQMV